MFFRYYELMLLFFFFKQKTAYEMRISDWSSDVCSSDLPAPPPHGRSEMMIRRLIRVALALAMVGAATPAFAIDASFYTYDGFAETVDEIGRASCRERVCQYV